MIFCTKDCEWFVGRCCFNFRKRASAIQDFVCTHLIDHSIVDSPGHLWELQLAYIACSFTQLKSFEAIDVRPVLLRWVWLNPVAER